LIGPSIFQILLDRGLDCGLGLFWSINIPVFSGSGPVQSWSFSGPETGLPSTSQDIILHLKDCLHAPSTPINLWSVGTFQERHIPIHFEVDPPRTVIRFPSTHTTFPGMEIIASFHHCLSFLNTEYVVPNWTPSIPAVPVPSALIAQTFKYPALMQQLWHRCLGHIGQDATRAVLTKDYVTGVKFDGCLSYGDVCVPCLLGKSPQQPYNHFGHRPAVIGHILVMDTSGPHPIPTPQGHIYNHNIGDVRSVWGSTKLQKSRLETYDHVVYFVKWLECTTGQKVLVLQCDGVREFVIGRLAEYLNGKGIQVQQGAPHAHQQMGIAERDIWSS
jgi:hypothetical protein